MPVWGWTTKYCHSRTISAICRPPGRSGTTTLRWVGAMLYRNGVIEETGLAAAVLNHPATGVAWLANKIAPL